MPLQLVARMSLDFYSCMAVLRSRNMPFADAQILKFKMQISNIQLYSFIISCRGVNGADNANTISASIFQQADTDSKRI
jgi:hypothetical protein